MEINNLQHSPRLFQPHVKELVKLPRRLIRRKIEHFQYEQVQRTCKTLVRSSKLRLHIQDKIMPVRDKFFISREIFDADPFIYLDLDRKSVV